MNDHAVFVAPIVEDVLNYMGVEYEFEKMFQGKLSSNMTNLIEFLCQYDAALFVINGETVVVLEV